MSTTDVLPLTPSASPDSISRRPVNLRSILIGLVGVIAICALVPYNDLAVYNSPLIGTYIPVGLLLFFLTIILLINAPLHRFAPGRALSTGELAVSLGMVMVGCSVPATGLMRYLPAALVGVWYQAGANSDYASILRKLNLPNWIFPNMPEHDPLRRASDAVIQDYYNRVGGTQNTFLAHFRAVPWHAWMTPIFMWAIFVFAFFAAILALAVIVRKQWVENERLPFPIAQVYLSLIEAPEEGRALNRLFLSKGFWLAAISVFAIHLINGLFQYDPKHFFHIPTEYNLSSVLANPPWVYMEPEGTRGDIMGFKHNAVFFSIIGITFFLQTKVAFSLWFFYVFYQFERILWGINQAEFTYPQQQDQQVGAMIPFALAILWVGRRHWMNVLRAMFLKRKDVKRNPPPNASDPSMSRYVLRSAFYSSPYLPLGLAGWILAIGLAIMIGWLIAAGCSIIGAIVLVLLMMMIMTVTARVVAETGLLFVQLGFPYWRPWILALTPPFHIRTTGRSFFYHGLFSMILGHDVRETLSTFSTHALKVADEAGLASQPNPQSKIQNPKSIGASFILCLALSLVVAYFVSYGAMLHVEYTHAVTLDTTQQTPLNPWATEWGIKSYVFAPTFAYLPPRNGPSEVHSRWGHFSFGFLAVTILSFLRLRFAWWPLHPVGLLIAYGWPIKQIWFSIFIGWLVKLLVVRFGGTNLFRSARNFFIGLIIGEASSVGFWLVVSLVLSSLGMDFKAIKLFPN